MPSFETRTTRVSLFGRFADAMTRRDIPPSAFEAHLEANGARPICKENGSFAFVDLEPKAAPYSIRVQSRAYRARALSASYPGLAPTSLARDGEDELYLAVTNVNTAQNRFEFDPIPFLPTIGAGATVIGESGYSATLSAPLEGEDVDFAEANTVTGLTAGEAVRIVRSDRLLLRPGPYYRFSEPATLLSARFVDSTPLAGPVEGALVVLDQVNGIGTTTLNLGGLVLHRVVLGASTVILGPTSAVEAYSNSRGEALLDFPVHLPITTLRLQVSHPDFVPLTQTVSVTAGVLSRRTRALTPV